MKKAANFAMILLLAVTLFASGCSSSKKSNCGCPNKKGMVGY
jgi:hypothetical protein